MAQGNTSVDFWIEDGFIGLLRIAAAKSDGKTFWKIWRQARSASSTIPGITPEYYRILRFGIEQDCFDFVDPVIKSLRENELYNKSNEERALLELASEYIAQKSHQTRWDKLCSVFRLHR